ncbi:MAG: hypothetical protein GY778_19455 [bacterium]|nr:hypothetical protein [bacterium]
MFAGAHPDHLELAGEVLSRGPTEVRLTGAGTDGLVCRSSFRRPGQSDWLWTPVRRVSTRRAPGEKFRVALIADAHIPILPPKAAEWATANLVKMINAVRRDGVDFVAFLGDEPCTGGYGDGPGDITEGRTEKRWRLWRRTYSSLLSDIPSFMVLGNHDGEAGYQQQLREEPTFLQRWSTIERKRHLLNPLPDTYPEGGEDDGWAGDPESPATGGADHGNCSPLQNYFAWRWGDALFLVLDVHRYTNVGGSPPTYPEEWTLGARQMAWFQEVLSTSRARWKLVLAHHLVGGYGYGIIRESDGRLLRNAYGRGGARFARVGEQGRVTELMKQHGAQLFLYGHDHIFAHQRADEIDFVCCGRPTLLSKRWWNTRGWREMYGDVQARGPHDFHAALGYTRLTVAPDEMTVEYVRTGTDQRGVENVSVPEGKVVSGFTVI